TSAATPLPDASRCGAKMHPRRGEVNPKFVPRCARNSTPCAAPNLLSVLFVRELELRLQQLLLLRRHRRVMAELDRVGALPARDRAQARLIIRDLREGHHALDRHEVAARGLRARDLAALAGDVRR